jgi:hypothetical protein
MTDEPSGYLVAAVVGAINGDIGGMIGLGAPDSLYRARSEYLLGAIEADDFERRVEAILERDPQADLPRNPTKVRRA